MQVAALERAGAEKIYKDHGVSGTTAKRPALLRCLKALDDIDTLIVWKLDRMGRSLHDVVIMLDDLHRRGIKFHSLTESFDTKTPMGRAMMQMASVLAELERNLITERTREGVKAAQRRGIIENLRRKRRVDVKTWFAEKLWHDGTSRVISTLIATAITGLFVHHWWPKPSSF